MTRLPLRLAALAFALTACTPNGLSVGGGGGGGGSTHVVDLNLTNAVVAATPYGTSAAYTPPVLTVAVGDSIVFKNTDSFNHTSTSIPASKSNNEKQFPSAYPFTGTALTQSGATLSGGWSSGAIQAGATSQTILADKAGTYLYGCFYHYGAVPTHMRGAIVVH
jgi:plastocyanin